MFDIVCQRGSHDAAKRKAVREFVFRDLEHQILGIWSRPRTLHAREFIPEFILVSTFSYLLVVSGVEQLPFYDGQRTLTTHLSHKSRALEDLNWSGLYLRLASVLSDHPPQNYDNLRGVVVVDPQPWTQLRLTLHYQQALQQERRLYRTRRLLTKSAQLHFPNIPCTSPGRHSARVAA